LMSLEKIVSRTWGRRAEGLFCGALAGALAAGIEALLRALFGVPSLAEFLGDQGIGLLPGNVFEFLLGVFGHNAKHFYFIGLLLAQVAGLAVLGSLAFSVRSLIINRRTLNALHRAANQQPDEEEGKPGEKGQPEDQQHRNPTEEGERAETDDSDYTPAERAALAAAIPRIQAPVGWPMGLALALAAWVLTGVVVLPVLGAGPFGANLPTSTAMVLVAMTVPALVFGASLPFMQRGLRRLTPCIIGSTKLQRTFSPTRRIFLKRVTIGLALLGAGSLAWRFITQGVGSGAVAGANSLDGPPPPTRITPPPTPGYTTWPPVSGQTPELTQTTNFYLVSKNIYGDPTLDASGWHLTIGGEGALKEITLSYQDLLNLPATEQITTLECISNPVGGSFMSSARWKGVPLKTLLEMVGMKTGVSKVIFRASDDYSDSIHLAKALDPMTLLVHTMNDAPLLPEHGFPARMIVPGIYGMKHCKWITSIELSTHDFLGYWQQRGWNDDAVINLGARIDVPADGDTLRAGKQIAIAGVAFAGAKGVSAVDVSTDNGASWQRANLRQPLGAVTWTLWELPWTPPGAATYQIVARMIDLQGYYQQPVVADTFPNGASGYHRISVTAK
jgi:DMSO/TMAO reductase YedYZ molybdopterin-dependent catalytic subunit